MKKISPLRRAFVLFLCAQPTLWVSNVALAQTTEESLRRAARGQSSDSRSEGANVGVDEDSGRDSTPTASVSSGIGAPDYGGSGASPASSVPPVDEPVDPDRYLLGQGDVLELSFWGIQNFKQKVTLDLEGRGFVPKVGFFTLKSKSLTEARKILRESVARFYPQLQFEVTLATPRTFLVQVVESVVKPGSYTGRAIDRVATIIAKAGGFAPGASKRRIELRHRDGSTSSADLVLYAQTGDVKYNPYVLDGDIVRVPFEDLAVTIQGAVNRPGRYELVNSKDLTELVTLAGGLSPSASHQLPVTVVRRMADDRQDLVTIDFPDTGLPILYLSREDSVRIPAFGELQRSVLLVGALSGAEQENEASTTRRLAFVEGDSVRTLLERAGGIGPLADLGGSFIVRNGAVIRFDLEALWVRRDMSADSPVELGDTIAIPFKGRNITVRGAVFTPGPYPYNPTFSIDEYVALAGGRNRFARPTSDIQVVTPDGKTMSYDPHLKVQPGSSLVVPERNFSRAEIVQIVLSVAGILLSGAALVISTR